MQALSCSNRVRGSLAVGSAARARRPLAVLASSGITQPAVEIPVTLKQPVGIVFSQKPGGPVFVEELVSGGAAEQTGLIKAGDVLARCSSVMLKSGKNSNAAGHGDFLYDNWEKVEFVCEGQEFKTVMAALKSNNPRWGIRDVTMVFTRPAA